MGLEVPGSQHQEARDLVMALVRMDHPCAPKRVLPNRS